MGKSKKILDKLNELLQQLPDKPDAIIITESLLDVFPLLERYPKEIDRVPVRGPERHGSWDEPHTHAPQDGKEVTYTQSGKRRHPNKFPPEVHNRTKNAIRKSLGLPQDFILECYEYKDEDTGEWFLIIEAGCP
jgi:hypothetical protein